MNQKEHLRKIKKETKLVKIERNIYIMCSILFLSTVIINILNIIYHPYLINGIILELNIIMISICTYTFIKKQEKINLLEDKKLELKIKYCQNLIIFQQD